MPTSSWLSMCSYFSDKGCSQLQGLVALLPALLIFKGGIYWGTLRDRSLWQCVSSFIYLDFFLWALANFGIRKENQLLCWCVSYGWEWSVLPWWTPVLAKSAVGRQRETRAGCVKQRCEHLQMRSGISGSTFPMKVTRITMSFPGVYDFHALEENTRPAFHAAKWIDVLELFLRIQIWEIMELTGIIQYCKWHFFLCVSQPQLCFFSSLFLSSGYMYGPSAECAEGPVGQLSVVLLLLKHHRAGWGCRVNESSSSQPLGS